MKWCVLLLVMMCVSLFAATDGPEVDPPNGATICVEITEGVQAFTLTGKDKVKAIAIIIKNEDDNVKATEKAIEYLKEYVKTQKKKKPAPKKETPKETPKVEDKEEHKAVYGDSINKGMFPTSGKSYENNDCRTGA